MCSINHLHLVVLVGVKRVEIDDQLDLDVERVRNLRCEAGEEGVLRRHREARIVIERAQPHLDLKNKSHPRKTRTHVTSVAEPRGGTTVLLIPYCIYFIYLVYVRTIIKRTMLSLCMPPTSLCLRVHNRLHRLQTFRALLHTCILQNLDTQGYFVRQRY